MKYLVLFVLIIGIYIRPGFASDAADNDTTVIHVRVAAGQFQLEPNLDSNLIKIDNHLAEAAAKNVDLIVFPELALTGYPPKDIEKLDYVNQKRTVGALEYIQKRANELSIAVAVGAAWKDEKNVWRNRAFFINEKGKILEYYDKIQQTSHERKFFSDGERLPTFNWRGIKMGMLICMDMRYPELWRLMRMSGAQLILHLLSAYGGSEWKVPVLDGTIRSRAAENGYYIVSCNNAGPIPMMVSAVYNPRGLIVSKANYAVEEIIIGDLLIGPPQGFVDFQNKIYKLERVSADE